MFMSQFNQLCHKCVRDHAEHLYEITAAQGPHPIWAQYDTANLRNHIGFCSFGHLPGNGDNRCMRSGFMAAAAASACV